VPPVSRNRLFSRPGASMTRTAFYVLLSLSTEERDSDELLEDIALSSGGRVIAPPTLATTLKRLLGSGLIAEVERTAYRLTRRGRTQLASELLRIESALEPVRARR
jgi:DNA-binding PadR family transcriptional regulator